MSIAEKLTTIAENEQRVYDSGYSKAESDMWDSIQDKGSRRYYRYGFFGSGWNKDTFKPLYDIIATDALGIFQDSQIYIDLKEFLESRGLKLDFSNATTLNSAFRDSGFLALPVIDTTGVTASDGLNNIFQNINAKSIEKLVLDNTGNRTLTSSFSGASNLEEIDIEGVIGVSVNFSSCEELTHESLMSIGYALKDYSGTSTTKSLIIGTKNQAKLNSSEKAMITQKGWTIS